MRARYVFRLLGIGRESETLLKILGRVSRRREGRVYPILKDRCEERTEVMHAQSLYGTQYRCCCYYYYLRTSRLVRPLARLDPGRTQYKSAAAVIVLN